MWERKRMGMRDSVCVRVCERESVGVRERVSVRGEKKREREMSRNSIRSIVHW